MKQRKKILKFKRKGEYELYIPWNSPTQNTGVGSCSLLQGNLPNPEIEPGSPALQADCLPAELPVKSMYYFIHFTH